MHESPHSAAESHAAHDDRTRDLFAEDQLELELVELEYTPGLAS